MRKLLISLLLVSAAASPALADPGDKADRQAARAERQQAHEQARAERSAPAERPQFNGRGPSVAPGGGPQQFVRGGGGGNGPDRPQFAGRPDPRQAEAFRGDRDAARQQRFDDRDARRDQRQQVIQDRRFDNEALRRQDRPLPPVMRPRVPVVSNVPRPWTQPPVRVDNRRGDDVRWSTDWRRDNRYDWRHWRDRNRNRFRIGIYYDPFGWGYQSFDIGWRLWPNYYSSSYWINDPWQYRLPYAPAGTQWIRYYNDALLVDMYTGEVVDVIHGFFW